MIFFFDFFYYNMKRNEVLTNFKDITRYIIYLQFEEQIHEINKIIEYLEYLVKYKYQRVNVYHKFALINDIKKFKKDLIRLHLQKLKDNPSLAVNSKPLYKLLSVK